MRMDYRARKERLSSSCHHTFSTAGTNEYYFPQLTILVMIYGFLLQYQKIQTVLNCQEPTQEKITGSQ